MKLNDSTILFLGLPSATLTKKGCTSIKKASKERGDENAVRPCPGKRVQIRLKKVHVPKQGMKVFESPALRSKDDIFCFKSNYLCGQPAMAGKKREFRCYNSSDYRTERYSPDSVPGKK